MHEGYHDEDVNTHWPGPDENPDIVLGVILDGLKAGAIAYARALSPLITAIKKVEEVSAKTHFSINPDSGIIRQFELISNPEPVDVRKMSIDLKKQPRKYPGVSARGRFEKRGL